MRNIQYYIFQNGNTNLLEYVVKALKEQMKLEGTLDISRGRSGPMSRFFLLFNCKLPERK